MEILTEPITSPALRAAAFDALAEMPGIELAHGVADLAGRRRDAIRWIRDRGFASELIFDPNTSKVLAQAEMILGPPSTSEYGVPAGTVFRETAYLRSGSLPPTTHKAGTSVEETDAGTKGAAPWTRGSCATSSIAAEPSCGNVSCETSAHGALCSVGSTAETFSFDNGQPAEITPGTALADGAGELASYGAVVSSGSIACTVPESDEPHGITPEDGGSGHGFEASRVSSRQRAY